MLGVSMVHLDTNYLIQSGDAGSPAAKRLGAWLGAMEPVGTSVVAWSEFMCGPVRTADVARARSIVGAPDPLTIADAELAAALFNLTGRRSRSLPDCLIAATAIRCGARLATINTADFQPFVPHGLVLA
jgi:predicted nucleic acid-binding protein